jgi:aerobic C4-dicarboxylate transport protein
VRSDEDGILARQRHVDRRAGSGPLRERRDPRPQSYVGAFADGDVLPVLLLAILTGWALTRIGAAGDPVRQAIGSFLHVVFAAFGFIIKLSPIGALGAMRSSWGRWRVFTSSACGS